jgi:HPr kinase/phosphorylase
MQSTKQVTVEVLVEKDTLGLRLIAGRAGIGRMITVPRIQKPGLALTGYREQLHENRLLTLGRTEIDYLSGIGDVERNVAFDAVIASNPACIVITRGLDGPEHLVEVCEEQGIPLLISDEASADFIFKVTRYLERKLAATTSIHGVLVDVLEVGILLVGKSGIGKSEAALDLVSRGHRLVADDVVMLSKPGERIVGAASATLGHHMEIRGLGIINIADLFGITAIRDHKEVDLVIEIALWEDGHEYDRLGVDTQTHQLLGVDLPLLRLPVRPGRNVATIIEVAARNQLLKEIGHYSARNFIGTLDAAVSGTPMGGRGG